MLLPKCLVFVSLLFVLKRFSMTVLFLFEQFKGKMLHKAMLSMIFYILDLTKIILSL